ncbi:hypothetical protein [Paenibacillus koleovorans]|uniref:hypothetical protein n=1 Tax=Paenibacillus koleovorans TaxID=121608 RepID=UPI000FDC5E6A|nr:hypothetical protein [Paenibacillus koleovorans]
MVKFGAYCSISSFSRMMRFSLMRLSAPLGAAFQPYSMTSGSLPEASVYMEGGVVGGKRCRVNSVYMAMA